MSCFSLNIDKTKNLSQENDTSEDEANTITNKSELEPIDQYVLIIRSETTEKDSKKVERARKTQVRKRWGAS